MKNAKRDIIVLLDMSAEFPPTGERSPIEWDESVPIAHRKAVESGLFDRIAEPKEYEHGEVVVSRYSDKIYQVYEKQGDNVTVGYDTEKEHVRKILAKGDIRSINGYAQVLYQIRQPTREIQIDKQGHAQIKYQVIEPIPPNNQN